MTGWSQCLANGIFGVKLAFLLWGKDLTEANGVEKMGAS
jgi:hypothetical protein